MKLGPALKITINEFYSGMMALMEEAEYMPVSEIFKEILTTFRYKSYLEGLGDDRVEERIDNIEELRNAITELEKNREDLTLGEYLENISLVSATDELEESKDYIKLMTIHNSKGLEFPVVFIAGMEDEVFPSQKADYDTNQLEEERRLCYVAITRAEKTLFICHANERFVYGQTQMRSRSRCLEEIPPHLLESKTKKEKPTEHASRSVKI